MPVRSNGQSNFVFGVVPSLLFLVVAPIIVLGPVAWNLIKKSPSNATEASGCSRGKGKCGYGASALLRSPLVLSGLLLLVQECVEYSLLDVHFVRAPVGVDEGIPGTLLELRVLFLQAVLGRVVAERHVARERTH